MQAGQEFISTQESGWWIPTIPSEQEVNAEQRTQWATLALQ
jgi:hypothetical protein